MFVSKHHRHHGRSRGHLFSIAAVRGDIVVAVAIVSRPRARMLQNGFTAEVVRLCSIDAREPGAQHATGACAMLYAASWRACRAMGYRKLVTYTLPTEGGESLRGAGFTLIGEAGGGSWDRKSRPRVDTHPTQEKLRWEIPPPPLPVEKLPAPAGRGRRGQRDDRLLTST